MGEQGPAATGDGLLCPSASLPAIFLLQISDAGSFAQLSVNKGSLPPRAALTQITAFKLLKKKKKPTTQNQREK